MSYPLRGGMQGDLQGAIAFNSGNSYRIDFPFEIPQNGDPIVLKYNVTEDTILTLSTIEIYQGGLQYKIFTEAQTTETGAFDDTVIIYPKNTSVPFVPAPATVLTGGSATFTGQQNTTLFVKASSGGGNRSNAVTGEETARGFGPSVIYAEISTLDGTNTDTLGILKQEFYRK